MLWKALEETCRKTMLKQLDPLDEYLTKARFAHSVFEVLKTKRKKGKQFARRSSGSFPRRHRAKFCRCCVSWVAPSKVSHVPA